MLGGVTRMTFSITVMAMEGTGSLQLIVPLMCAIFTAKVVGDAVCLSIYDTHIKIRGAPVLIEHGTEPGQRMVAEKVAAGELACTQVVALPPVVRVSQVAITLRNTSHSTYPVTPDVDQASQTDGVFQLHGVVKRSQLLLLLKHRIGMFRHDSTKSGFPPSKSHIPATQEARYALLEKLEHIPIKIRPKQDIDEILGELKDSEMDYWLDLRPFMQRTPFVLQGNASMARAYRLFRTMGLHHMFVGSPKPQVIGMLTRKDLTEENAAILLGSKANQGQSDARLRRNPSRLPTMSYYAEHLRLEPLSTGPENPHADPHSQQHDQERAGLLSAVRV
eukprot:jgi/Botrbrau1/5586/Bobra.97_2s0016.2